MAKPYFIVSTFAVRQTDTAWNEFKANAFQLVVEMSGKLPPWKLFGALSSVTDFPNSVLHLWRVDEAKDLVDGKHYFEESALATKMMGACDGSSVQLLERLPYDPEFVPGGASTQSPSEDGRFYYLWVELTLRPGPQHRKKFINACDALLKKMATALNTWTLLAAGSTVSGPPDTVLHLWQLEDANALLEGMNWFGENNPDYGALATSCLRQRQQLFTATLYNPLGQNGHLSEQDEKHKQVFNDLIAKKGIKHG